MRPSCRRSDVSVSFLDIRGASTWSPTHVPIAVQRGSIWSHREWSFGPNTTASFAGPWAVFTHKVWPTGATPGTWVWNWKRNISKRVNLQVSSEIDGLVSYPCKGPRFIVGFSLVPSVSDQDHRGLPHHGTQDGEETLDERVSPHCGPMGQRSRVLLLPACYPTQLPVCIHIHPHPRPYPDGRP